MSAWTVTARSSAEIPVVMPLRASTVTVKAVDLFGPSDETMRGIWSASSRSPTIGIQISPQPWRAIKLIASDVQNSAAIARSPSFSRSSSSTMITNFPAWKSSMACSIVARGDWTSGAGRVPLVFSVKASLQQAFNVFRHYVNLKVDARANRLRCQCDRLLRERNKHDREPVRSTGSNRQTDAIDGNESFFNNVGKQNRVHGDDEVERRTVICAFTNQPNLIHVSLDVMTADPGAHQHRSLEIESVADAPVTQVAAA